MVKTSRDMTDADLTRHYKASGDLTALGDLYQRYMPLVFGVCLKYLKDREESRDAVMQIFEKLVHTLREHEVEYFKSWLYTTARNHCLMHLRSHKNKQFEEISPSLMETDINRHHEDEEDLELNLVNLERCIEKLANEQRHCVQLFYLQQKCYKEITTVTGFDLNSVKSYIQNGKRNLKICLSQHGRS
jgi:RNA polymerase sigma factor (sigma-70 family)